MASRAWPGLHGAKTGRARGERGLPPRAERGLGMFMGESSAGKVERCSRLWRSCASGPVVRRSVSRSRAVFGLVSRSSCAAWESPCRGV